MVTVSVPRGPQPHSTQAGTLPAAPQLCAGHGASSACRAGIGDVAASSTPAVGLEQD